MLVCKIWWVNCDKQYWEDEETGQKQKKHRWVEVSQLFLSDTVLEKEFNESEELLIDAEVNL